MFRNAKHMKDRCANTRRTATSLKDLSRDASLGIADQGLLLKAAQVLDSMSERMHSEAKSLKTKELAYAKAIAGATKDATGLLALWPRSATVDKIAIIDVNNHRSHLCTSVRDDKTAKELGWSLNYWLDQALREIPSDIAYQSVNKKLSVADLMTTARTKFDTLRADAENILLAARIDNCLNPQQAAA
jgi:hypothetical protein